MLLSTLGFSFVYLIATWLLSAAVARYAGPRLKGLPTAVACFAVYNIFTLVTAVGTATGIGLPKALASNELTEIVIISASWVCLCAMLLFVPIKQWPPEEVFERTIFCSNCRYDLHGNLSGACPECGLKITVQTSASPDPS